VIWISCINGRNLSEYRMILSFIVLVESRNEGLTWGRRAGAASQRLIVTQRALVRSGRLARVSRLSSHQAFYLSVPASGASTNIIAAPKLNQKSTPFHCYWFTHLEPDSGGNCEWIGTTQPDYIWKNDDRHIDFLVGAKLNTTTSDIIGELGFINFQYLFLKH
jgi:hypothetical protein